MITLLASADFTTHILAYSYLLNQTIKKLRRVADVLLKPLGRVYLHLG